MGKSKIPAEEGESVSIGRGMNDERIKRAQRGTAQLLIVAAACLRNGHRPPF